MGNSKKKLRRNPADNEEGLAVVLLALFLVVILAFAGLAIDTSMVSTSKAQYEDTAQFAALGAVESFMANTGTIEERLEAAATRVKEIVGYNIPLMVGSAFFEDKSVTQTAVGEVLTQGSGENGELIPGQWYFSDAPNCTAPCFEAATSVTDPINAFRVVLNLHPDSGISAIFAKVVDFHTFTFSAQATASLVPRHGVFMFDLTSSIYRDTHQQGTANYALKLRGNTCPPPSTLASEVGALLENPLLWDNLPSGPRPAGAVVETDHYQIGSDNRLEYECHEVDSVGSAVGIGESFQQEAYYIDRVVAPEPLTSVLNGIHLAMEIFASRSVAGDLMGIIGFDDNVLSPRFMDMERPDLSSAGPYKDFYEATDSNFPQKTIDRFLFPRRNGRNGVFAKTDLPISLKTALEMLENATASESSESFVVLFSDGRTTCTKQSSSISVCPDPNRPNDCVLVRPRDVGGCYDSEGFFNASMEDTKEILADSLAAKKIAFHNILVGDRSGAHTKLIKHGNRCATDADSRAHDYPYVDVSGGNWSGNEFLGPNQLYEDTVSTSGHWVPLRPCCKLDPSASCDPSASDKNQLTSYIDGLCSGLPADGDVWGSAVDNPTIQGFLTNSSGNIDGRIRCDPLGRSKDTQIQDAITEIMSSNPYVLVE